MAQNFLNNASSFLTRMNEIQSVKKTQTFLPITRRTAWCTPCSTKSDLALKTGIVSPGEFDRQLTMILFEHTVFRNDKGEVTIGFDNFCSGIANLDKLALLWAFWKATYDYVIKDREIACPNCKTKQITNASLDDILHEDSFIPWDQTDDEGNIIPFKTFRDIIVVKNGGYEYEFHGRIPSIEDNNRVINSISVEALQTRFKLYNEPYSDTDKTILYCEKIGVRKIGEEEYLYPNSEQELIMCLDNSFPPEVLIEFIRIYEEKYDKYKPKFYSKCECPNCHHQFKINVDIEVELTWRKRVELLRLDPSVITSAINDYIFSNDEEILASMGRNTDVMNSLNSEELPIMTLEDLPTGDMSIPTKKLAEVVSHSNLNEDTDISIGTSKDEEEYESCNEEELFLEEPPVQIMDNTELKPTVRRTKIATSKPEGSV